MLLKFKKSITEWYSFYANALRNRLRCDKNLSDVMDIQAARDNLGINGDNNHTHYHDDRYLPAIKEAVEKEAAIRDSADAKLNNDLAHAILDGKNVDDFLQQQIDELKRRLSALEIRVDTDEKNIKNELENIKTTVSKIKVNLITGVAYHGSILPIPPGADRKNCRYLVSLNSWTNTRSDNKYTYDMYISVDDSTGRLTCYTKTSGRNGTGGTYPGYANYLVVDITSIAS